MACQSVALLVHMAKTRHSGRKFWQKTARKRPGRVTLRDSDATYLAQLQYKALCTAARFEAWRSTILFL
jgi:hypothetical protein